MSVRELQDESAQLEGRGELVEAIACLDEAIGLQSRSATLFYQRGRLRRIAGQHREAIVDLDRAIELRPRFAVALTERGLAYCNSGKAARGIEDYDAALRLEPAYAVALENKGLAMLQSGRTEEGVSLLSRSLRIAPGSMMARYNRGMAYVMLEQDGAALDDLEPISQLEEDSRPRAEAAAWVRRLREENEAPPRPSPLAELMWSEHLAFSLERSVAELLASMDQHQPHFLVIALPQGGHAVLSLYSAGGVCQRLTELADLIGESILPLPLGQLLDAPVACTPVAPTASLEEAQAAAAASGNQTLVMRAGELLGVLAIPVAHDPAELPTSLGGGRPHFGRSGPPSQEVLLPPNRPPLPWAVPGTDARVCAGCAREVEYYLPVLADDRLHGLACPHCRLDPVPAWIERRMRPGRWSRAGFLGDHERVDDRIERDSRAVEALGLSHAQLAEALGSLLDLASEQLEDEVLDLQLEGIEQLASSGQRGFDGVAVIPIQPALQDVLQALQEGVLPPLDQGLVVGDLQIFLQVTLGYQACPWTILRPPYSPEPSPWKMMHLETPAFSAVAPELGHALRCSGEVSYRHGDRDFLLLNRVTRETITGAGMMPHLIGEHRFFQGEHCPYRLDPRKLAEVLGLLDGASPS